MRPSGLSPAFTDRRRIAGCTASGGIAVGIVRLDGTSGAGASGLKNDPSKRRLRARHREDSPASGVPTCVSALNPAGFTGGGWMWSCCHAGLVRGSLVSLFGLGRPDVADGFERPAMVEPVHPFARGVLDRLEAAPRPSPAGHLGLVEAVDAPPRRWRSCRRRCRPAARSRPCRGARCTGWTRIGCQGRSGWTRPVSGVGRHPGRATRPRS